MAAAFVSGLFMDIMDTTIVSGLASILYALFHAPDVLQREHCFASQIRPRVRLGDRHCHPEHVLEKCESGL